VTFGNGFAGKEIVLACHGCPLWNEREGQDCLLRGGIC
jgi:hypothetical protein